MGAVMELLRLKGGRQKTAEGEYRRLVELEGQGRRLGKSDVEALENCLAQLGRSPETFQADAATYARRIELETFVSECDETKLKAAWTSALAETTEQKKFDRLQVFRAHERTLAEQLEDADKNLSRLAAARRELASLKAASR
jgi:hypothetical protein